MGLFDAFGVGGGSLSIQLQTPQVQAGGAAVGVVVYTGGRRAQQITNIKIRMNRTVNQPGKGPNGQQQSSRSEAVVPEFVLANAFTAQPGQGQQFQFQLQIPAGSPSSTPGMVTYSISASADIDGEVDPGAHAEVQVFGTPYAAATMQNMGGGYVDPNAYSTDPYGKSEPFNKVDPNKGGWVDPNAKGGWVDPNKGGYVDPNAKGGWVDPNAKGGWVDPNKGGYVDPNAKGGYVDPNAKGGYVDPNAKGGYGKGGVTIGSHVQAQWTNGQYYGATVHQENGGMYLVQWDDGSPALWVKSDQLALG